MQEELQNDLERTNRQLGKCGEDIEPVGDLAVLSQSANENIKETLSQFEKKDKYIKLLQAAKSKADFINLALAVNLKVVLKKGIEDEDAEIRVVKTVVYINLSDKMLYQSGSSDLTPERMKFWKRLPNTRLINQEDMAKAGPTPVKPES